MKKKYKIKKISEIFCQTMELHKKTKLKTKNMINTKKWDSLSHIRLILILEEEFKIRFTPNQIEKMNSYTNVINTIDTLVK